jgi:fucose 4-O-acetylase-like acetyltransferase
MTDLMTTARPARTYGDSLNSTARRDQAIDVARGITIIAIVMGHVVLGLTAAGLQPFDHSDGVLRGLYLLRLPTLAYLSGLFVSRGDERSGAKGFAINRLLLFGWLYVLWSVVQGSVKALAGSLTNSPVGWSDVLRLWIPAGQLWFLPWLMAVTVVAVIAQPWTSRRRALLTVGGACVLSVAVWGVDPVWAFTRGWSLLAPFLLGCAMTARRHAKVFEPVLLSWVLTVVCGAIWVAVSMSTQAVPPTTGGLPRTPVGISLGVLGCIVGTAACLSLAALLARTPVGGVLAPIGRRSLEIFLAHIVVAAGARIVLEKAGLTVPVVHLLVGIALGVIVPMALANLADRLGWRWVFRTPALLHRA